MRSGTVAGVRKTALLDNFGPGFRRGAGAVAVFALVAAAAPAVAQNYQPPIYPAQVVVEVGPPPLRAEVIPARPGPRYVWQGGHWWWRGGRWMWGPGRWVIGPRVGAVWVAGHWAHRRRGWVWIDGHWR